MSSHAEPIRGSSIPFETVAAPPARQAVNLLPIPTYYDIALRDIELALGAAALARLSRDFESKSDAKQ